MRKKHVIVLIVTILCMVIFFIFGMLAQRMIFDKSNSNKSAQRISLSYNKHFPRIKVSNVKGRSVNVESIFSEHKTKIVFYISSKCESCNKIMDSILMYKHLLGTDKYQYVILMSDSINVDNYKQYGIKNNEIYALSNSKINMGTPCIIMLDNKDTISFISDKAENLIKRIIATDGRENLVKKANQFFEEKATGYKGKPVMVYFRMEGCPDCKAVTGILHEKEIENKFRRIDIYSNESYGEHKNVDVNEIFCTIYNIDWYPSFVLIRNNDSTVLGKMGRHKLEQELKSY